MLLGLLNHRPFLTCPCHNVSLSAADQVIRWPLLLRIELPLHVLYRKHGRARTLLPTERPPILVLWRLALHLLGL